MPTCLAAFRKVRPEVPDTERVQERAWPIKLLLDWPRALLRDAQGCGGTVLKHPACDDSTAEERLRLCHSPLRCDGTRGSLGPAPR